MAFSSQNDPEQESIAEINITPFVDVVLVLLIIFMITAGVVEFGLNIDVPRTKEVESTAEDLDYIQVTSNGQLYYNSDPVSIYDIVPKVKAKTGEGDTPAIYLRAHKSVPWEVVAQVFAECGAGGVAVNAVTKPMERNPRRRR